VPAPDLVSGRGVTRLDESPDAVFSATYPHQNFPVYGDYRSVQGVAPGTLGDLVLPELPAVPGVERHEFGVERSHVNSAVVYRDPPIDRTAAVHRDVEVVGIFPLLRPGGGVERNDMIERSRDVQRSVENYRAGLEGVGNSSLVAPGEL
jgi:hypothetical protein